MNLRDAIQKETLELDRVEETLSTKQKDWLKDIATWVKDEIDQDPKNLGENYEHFLSEQAKVFAYQGGFDQRTARALVNRAFCNLYQQDIRSYAGQQWQAHLFKPDPNARQRTDHVRQNINHGPEM